MSQEAAGQRPAPRTRTRGGAKAPPRNIPDPPRRILLATPALPIADAVFDRVRDLAEPGSVVLVLGIAKVFGTSLGIPHPGLQPTKAEWEGVRTIVNDAAERLRAEGFDTRVALSRSRNVPKMISRWAEAKRMHAIVVPDPQRHPFRRLIEGELTREISRRTVTPVHAVPVPPR